eukprot:6192291-Pleurochrysis_carterae.AAC.1
MQAIAVQRQTEVYKRSAITSRVDINTLSRLCSALADNERNAAAQSSYACQRRARVEAVRAIRLDCQL